MRSMKTALTVIGAIVVLLLAGNTVAYAATGGKFVLGFTNKANKVTTLKRTTGGPALQLLTTSGSAAPMAVNGRGTVANLSSDMVDGLDSSALKTPTQVFTKDLTAANNFFHLAVPVGTGTYLVSYSAYLKDADSVPVDCYLDRHDAVGSTYFGESRFTAGANTPGLTGSGYVNLTAGATLTLTCSATGAMFTTYAGEPIQVVATRTDLAGTSALRVAPSSARVSK